MCLAKSDCVQRMFVVQSKVVESKIIVSCKVSENLIELIKNWTQSRFVRRIIKITCVNLFICYLLY